MHPHHSTYSQTHTHIHVTLSDARGENAKFLKDHYKMQVLMFLSQRGKTHNLPLSRFTVISKDDAKMGLDSKLEVCGMSHTGEGIRGQRPGSIAKLWLCHLHSIQVTYLSCLYFLGNILREKYCIPPDVY